MRFVVRTVGGMVGALIITYLLTRLVGWLARRWLDGRTSAFVAFGAVLVFALAMGSTTGGLAWALVPNVRSPSM
jgi:predicted PurR-regulated permease PerM